MTKLSCPGAVGAEPLLDQRSDARSSTFASYSCSCSVWRLRDWARVAVIVVQSLAIVTSLLGLVAALQGGDVALSLGGTLIGVGVSGYIIYWFASHGEYFD